MARARIVYQFGQLVEQFTEQGDDQLKSVKDSFRELGLRLPFLEEDDVTTALAFLKSIDVWRGKSTNVILKGRLKKQRQKLRRSLSLSDIKNAKDTLVNRHTMSCSDLTRVTHDDEFDIIRRQLINKREKTNLQVVGDVKPPVCKVNPFKSKDPQVKNLQKVENGIVNGQAVVKVQVAKTQSPKTEHQKYFKPAPPYSQTKVNPNIVQLSQYSADNKTKNDSRVRLTVQALDTIILQPSKFHRIEFNDGLGHFFKRADVNDKQLYPHGEFFTASVRGKEHFFISLQISKFQDCGMDANCMRRDCPIHLINQFKIEHWYTKEAFSNGCNYRLKRIYHPRQKILPHLDEELYLTPLDADNFNIYVQNAMNLPMASCAKKLMGKSVPLVVLHALVQLRQNSTQQIDLVDWREIIAELEIIPRWPVEQNPMRFFLEHVVDNEVRQYKRPEYNQLLQRCVDELSLFYSSFLPIINKIDLAKSARQKQKLNMQSNLYNVPKRAKYEQGRSAMKWH